MGYMIDWKLESKSPLMVVYVQQCNDIDKNVAFIDLQSKTIKVEYQEFEFNDTEYIEGDYKLSAGYGHWVNRPAELSIEDMKWLTELAERELKCYR